MYERLYIGLFSIPCAGASPWHGVGGLLSAFRGQKSRLCCQDQDAIVRKELTRSGTNGAAHQCVHRGGLCAVPIFRDIPKV
jgi:hypothetical protein